MLASLIETVAPMGLHEGDIVEYQTAHCVPDYAVGTIRRVIPNHESTAPTIHQPNPAEAKHHSYVIRDAMTGFETAYRADAIKRKL
ncbi:hypothetical protein H4R34_002176 [Dimargaris verticillata]|uniref:Uncharacterized protein n=1 Tax=Dimargaris verticillata TaxID=2761393 RepID=A0A9W8B9Y7_9FUNG|nr:hypothetical protein H4R34_002176 [Dimargaris verticillata]